MELGSSSALGQLPLLTEGRTRGLNRSHVQGLVAARHAKGRPMMAVRAPFTGEELARLPRQIPKDVHKAARIGRAAQQSWSRTSFAQRARIFLRLHDLMLERQDEAMDLIQLEVGKARGHAFEEVADVAIVARYYATEAERLLKARRRRGALPGATWAWEYHHPRGLVGIIAPWNYPLTLAITDAIPALMAGNACLVKADSQTPLCALWAERLLEEAGLPAGLFQVLVGPGASLGPALLDNADFVQFTGSTHTGRVIARQAAERLIPCSLELGGKNPMLVFSDCDQGAAVEGAIRGCFAGAGQLCIAFERLYIQRPIFDRFVERLVERTRRIQLGAQLSWEPEVGSLISTEQLEKVQAHVEDAVQKGAEVLCGGRPRPDLGPFFYEPTLLTGVTEQMRLHEEETFGPVVALYPFETAEEAIHLANGTPYGLNASVWTRRIRWGRRVASRIQAGSVNVNEAYAAAWASVDAPMGGFKQSGLGRRHGAEGILKYTQSQTVAVQRGLPLAPSMGLGEEGYSRLMTRALRLLRRVPGYH